MYKCARCQEPILTSLNTVGIQCKKCGSKVFYKERRYKWVVECRDNIMQIQNELKEFFNLLVKARY